MIEYLQVADSPQTMAKRLASRNYRADTIHAALMNEFGESIGMTAISAMVRKNDKARNLARMNADGHKLGVMLEDEKYRQQMHEANNEFVARLMAARAA